MIYYTKGVDFMRKTVLVTGSSRGIGKSIALSFAKDQNNNIVINCSKDKQGLMQTKEEILKINKNILAIQCDLAYYENVSNMFEQINSTFNTNGVDVLINNAGISSIELFNTQSIETINKNISTNLMSAIYCSKCAITDMINKKSGTIINISSIWGEVGASMEVVYSTAKAGIIGFTKALAKENAPSNIRINAISVGIINTDMNNFLTEEERDNLIDEIPIGRFGEAEEISKLCIFLSNDDSSYITGQVIRIDGGLL